MSGGEIVDVLANWLWQGSAVALAATAILRTSRRMSATSRYHLWWVTLSVVLVLPVAPWFLEGREIGAGFVGAVTVAGQAESGAPGVAGVGVVLPILPAWALTLLALGWLGWALVSASRTLRALVALREAKRAARPFPAAREARLESWRALRAEGRRATLGVSDRVRAAAVLGLTSPSIVVAPSALAALDDHELDQIVVHEWAHVQRRDDLARLVQRVIVACAGLHPAVWWIDRQLNLERETACDDWAINATGSGRGLAVCLTKLAAMPGRPADAVLLPAALLSSQLTTRVVRLLDRSRNTSTARTAGAAMLAAPVLGALALVVASVELVVTSPKAPEEPRPAGLVRPAAVAVAEPTVFRRVAPLPGRATGTGRTIARRADHSRREAPAQARILAPPTAAEMSSQLQGADGGAPPIALAQAPRPERVVSAPPPAIESTLGVDLMGLKMPVPAGVLPAMTEGSGASGIPAAPSATPWGVAADAGVTVGKGTQKAAVATAGLFTRLSKSITGVF